MASLCFFIMKGKMYLSMGTGGAQGFPPLPLKYLLLIDHGTRGKINVLSFIYTDGPQQDPMESFNPMVTQMTLYKQKGSQYTQEKTGMD